ncbi:MAG: beta-ketoacyl synthase N-terminal-like domain-containing protein, partial [Pseudomonadota bacterium]
ETASPTRRQGENGFDPIAIVGTACRLPGGVADLDALERLLLDGVDAVGLAPAARLADWDAVPAAFRRGGFVDGIDLFDADFFGISPREAVQMDPQHRLLLELAWQALENAGFSPPALRGSRTGVFVGITGTEYAEMARSSGQADAHAVGGQFLNAAAGRLSHALGLNGPSLAVDTACSSSAMALHLACNALWAGECDAALAGGANLLLAPSTSQMLVQAKMLSPHGRCATFDAAADGYVRAEACALVVLKRLSRAQADGDRVLATILGTASNHDGASSGFTVPNGHAQQAVIRAALAAAQVTASDVSYVEAHGTGTSLGDPIEMHALDAVFGEGRSKPLLVGSIKTNIGHAEAAAGVAGLLKLVVALRRSHIPAHLHFQSINPHIGVSPGRVAVAARAVHWEPIAGRRIAGLSAFGASGTNVHLILQQAPPAPASFHAPATTVLALSARRAEDLGVLADQLMSTPDPMRAWPEATLVRSSLPYRLCAVGNDVAQIREQIKAKLVAGHSTRAGKPQIAFLFTGQGAQYAGMAH